MVLEQQTQLLILAITAIAIVIAAVAFKWYKNYFGSDSNTRTLRKIKNYREVTVDESLTPFDALMAHIKNNAKRLYATGNFEKEAVALWKITEESARPLLVLVMGEFKTGKSTFVNLLLKDSVLKTDAAPATAVVSLLRYGEKKRVVIHKWDETTAEYAFEKLAEITAEGDDEKQKLRDEIEYVEIFYPNEVLKSINFVDTPGLNVHNTRHIKSTESFQQKADLVLWIFNATRTAARTELSEIAALGNRLKPLAIVNRMDAIDPEEETPEEVLDNIRQRLGNTVQDVIGISALQAKTAMNAKDTALLEQSGWTNFYNQLQKQIIEKSGELKFNSFVDKIRDYFNVFSYSLNNMEIKLKEKENFFSDRKSAQAILRNKLSAFNWGIKQVQQTRERISAAEKTYQQINNKFKSIESDIRAKAHKEANESGTTVSSLNIKIDSCRTFINNNNESVLTSVLNELLSCKDSFNTLFGNQTITDDVAGMEEYYANFNLYESQYLQDNTEMRQWIFDLNSLWDEYHALKEESSAVDQAKKAYDKTGFTLLGFHLFGSDSMKTRYTQLSSAYWHHYKQFEEMMVNVVDSYFALCSAILKKNIELAEIAAHTEACITSAKNNAENEMAKIYNDFDKEKANYALMQNNLMIGKEILAQLQQAIAS